MRMTARQESVRYGGETLALPVYLDHHATTPLDPRVLEAMLPYFGKRFGNPHSVHHAYGWAAEEAVEQARTQVAALIGARAQEIVFTSGATESNNLAIRGAAANAQGKQHVVTVESEHPCVLESCRALVAAGWRVTWLPVRPDGLLDLEALAEALADDTALVSVMAVNHEIGVIQPLAEIGALCREKGVLFHSDAAQAAGRIPLDVKAMSVDLMSLSAHKLYGPKGIGALYVRGRPPVPIEPLIVGGGQERGLRSGTLPTPLCVGFGAAADIARREMAADAERIGGLRDHLLARLTAALPELRLNGDRERRVTGNLNLRVPGLDGEELLSEIGDVAASTGSACSSASLEPSPVLRALGLTDEEVQGSIRLGLGRFTSRAEVDFAAERIVAAVARVRAGTGA